MVNRKRGRKKRYVSTLLIIITLAAVAVTVWALYFRNPKTVLAPDYAPQQTEENAESIENDDSEKLEQPEGGGSVSLTYSTEVTIHLGERQASLLFANPGKSNQDMIVQLVIQDTVVIQSGLLTPGNQVTKLDLLEGVEKQDVYKRQGPIWTPPCPKIRLTSTNTNI